MSNSPKKVIDTDSGRVFPALNRCYRTLLREGELEEMRIAGKLKDNPEKDIFGYYRMREFYPGRFVQEDDTLWTEVKRYGLQTVVPDDPETQKKKKLIYGYLTGAESTRQGEIL